MTDNSLLVNDNSRLEDVDLYKFIALPFQV